MMPLIDCYLVLGNDFNKFPTLSDLILSSSDWVTVTVAFLTTTFAFFLIALNLALGLGEGFALAGLTSTLSFPFLGE